MISMAGFLQLIRWKNLSLMLYTQLLINFVFLKFSPNSLYLAVFPFILYIGSMLLIMAAGYVFNDLIDFKTDAINKPKKLIVTNLISIENTKVLYKILNTLGIAFGIGLALHLKKPSVTFIFIGASLLLYYYSKKLKQLPLVGNIAIAFLIGVTILIPILIVPESFFFKSSFIYEIKVLSALSIFAFFINLIREIVKDIQDVKGDYSLQMNTLPILIGRIRSLKLTSILCIISILGLFFIIISYGSIYRFTTLYLVLTSVLPLIYLSYKLPNAKTNLDYKIHSNLLKIIMFLGINTLLTLSITH